MNCFIFNIMKISITLFFKLDQTGHSVLNFTKIGSVVKELTTEKTSHVIFIYWDLFSIHLYIKKYCEYIITNF